MKVASGRAERERMENETWIKQNPIENIENPKIIVQKSLETVKILVRIDFKRRPGLPLTPYSG